jgi:hypothetical protein
MSASRFSGLRGKSATGSYWCTTSTVVKGVGCGEFVTVAPLNVTSRIGT